MKLRRVRQSIAGRPGVSDHPPAHYRHSLAQAIRIAIQVRLVVAVGTGVIELVYRLAACSARKHLPNLAIADRMNRRATRRHDVNCFVTTPKVHLTETVVKIGAAQTRYRRANLKPGLGRPGGELTGWRAEDRRQEGNRGESAQSPASILPGLFLVLVNSHN